MKHFIKIFTSIVLLVLLVACEKSNEVYDYTLNEIIDSIEITYQEGDDQDRVTQDLGLPTTSPLDDRTQIIWQSSNTSVISNQGRVTRDDDTVTIILTYQITYGPFSITKELEVDVLGNILTISFNSDGGSVVEEINASEGETIDAPVAPTKLGYTFEGWYLEDVLYTFDKMPADSIELIAHWEAIAYTLIYELDGGENHIDNPDSITIEDQDVLLSDPIKEGYRFEGWYLDELYEVEVSSISLNDFTETYTLYAKWEIKTYTITFIENGGSSVADMTTTFNTLIEAPSEPTREAYTFEGWYIDRVYITKFVFDTMPSNDITLYAHWVFDQNYTYTGYYSGADGLDGDLLITFLYDLIHDGFSGVTYGQARYILDETDESPEQSNKIVLVYTADIVSGTWDSGNTWNREHVWPQSKLGFDADNGTVNSASDLHNLKPADPSENSSRSNKWFGEPYSSNNAYMYEPRDEVKGDIARILFYMDIMYDYLTLVELEDGEEADYYEMGDLSTLLSWHEEDPVDDFERNRNEVIYSYQGNRNPFIDHPEFVDKIWGVDTTLLSTEHGSMLFHMI